MALWTQWLFDSIPLSASLKLLRRRNWQRASFLPLRRIISIHQYILRRNSIDSSAWLVLWWTVSKLTEEDKNSLRFPRKSLEIIPGDGIVSFALRARGKKCYHLKVLQIETRWFSFVKVLLAKQVSVNSVNRRLLIGRNVIDVTVKSPVLRIFKIWLGLPWSQQLAVGFVSLCVKRCLIFLSSVLRGKITASSFSLQVSLLKVAANVAASLRPEGTYHR